MERDDIRDTEPTRAQMEAESIKAAAQAAQFYNDMTEILEPINISQLPLDLQETLVQLVKTTGSGSDIQSPR